MSSTEAADAGGGACAAIRGGGKGFRGRGGQQRGRGGAKSGAAPAAPSAAPAAATAYSSLTIRYKVCAQSNLGVMLLIINTVLTLSGPVLVCITPILIYKCK